MREGVGDNSRGRAGASKGAADPARAAGAQASPAEAGRDAGEIAPESGSFAGRPAVLNQDGGGPAHGPGKDGAECDSNKVAALADAPIPVAHADEPGATEAGAGSADASLAGRNAIALGSDRVADAENFAGDGGESGPVELDALPVANPPVSVQDASSHQTGHSMDTR